MTFKLHSKRYFNQTLLLTAIILMSLCLLFVLLMTFRTSTALKDSIYQTQSINSEDYLYRASTQLDEISAIGSSISTVNVPYQELIYKNNYWGMDIWNKLIASHTGNNGYIKNIETVVDGHSINPSALTNDCSLGKIGYFEVYTSNDNDIVWPYLFDMQTSFRHNDLNDVTITISAYHLSKQIFSNADKTRCDYLLTPDGMVLLTNDKSAFFQDINTLYPGILQKDGLGSELMRYDTYYAFLSSTNKNGLRVLSLVPKSAYATQQNSIILQMLLLIFLLCPFSLFISYFLSQHFYAPVKSLVEMLRTYVQDDINEYEDEIAFIHKSISQYIADKDATQAQLTDVTRHLQDAQSAVLQHQINHHFLFNTLENIKALSIKHLGFGNEVENGIILLNNIISEGIYQKKVFVSLSYELQLVRSYLCLMQLRFPNIHLNWDVDESLMDCMVYKFSLQPILENCFVHAFSGPAIKDKQITISISQNNEILKIRICDNGCGIKDEVVQRIRQMLDNADLIFEAAHVGIVNVHQRIVWIFGKRYGITIENTHPGTAVQISYPIHFPADTASPTSTTFPEVATH